MGFFKRRDRAAAADVATPDAPPPAPPVATSPAGPGRPRREDWRSYDSVAEGFDRYVTRSTGPFAQDLVEILELQPGMRVLDLGAGSGIAAEPIRAAVGAEATVAAVDASVEMVRIGRRSGRPAAFVAAQARDLPFRDMTFDAQLANFVVAHFPNLETGLYDMRRVLRPGAKLGVTAWTDTKDAFGDTWVEVAERHVGREILRDERARLSPHEERLGRPETLRDVLYQAGFRKIRVERRQHRVQWTREEFLASRASLRSARFIRNMLGEAGYARFSEDLATTFADRFPETLGDTNDALVAVGLRED